MLTCGISVPHVRHRWRWRTEPSENYKDVAFESRIRQTHGAGRRKPTARRRGSVPVPAPLRAARLPVPALGLAAASCARFSAMKLGFRQLLIGILLGVLLYGGVVAYAGF